MVVRPKPGPRRRSVVRLVITLALPVSLIVYSVAFYDSIADLGLDSRAYPQAAMALLGVLLAGQIWHDIRQWWGQPSEEGFRETWQRWRGTAYAAGWTLVFVWAMGWVGFYTSLVVYVALLLPMIGVRRVRTIVLFTVGTVAGIYLLFDLVLAVRLPSGLLVE